MKIKEILNRHLKEIKLDKKELSVLEKQTKKFVSYIKEKIRKQKIKASVFIGGSLAKKTIMKKSSYDVDVFIRFAKKYSDKKISQLLDKTLINVKNRKIHGSRDYFQVQKEHIKFEIIPVTKIFKPEKMRNITDLSYFHVSYVKNKIKQNPKLADEILLAKSFCHANDIYGAESYISGFSGYALELLIIYYNGFVKMLRELIKKEKIIIDPEKYYKNKNIELELNESKLNSPIIFIDPTYKKRNALAALSYETFEKFKKQGKSFLKKPSLSYFKKRKINPKNYNLILNVYTEKQEGDIAGSKLLKFYKLITRELEKYFDIKKKEFKYSGKKALYYFDLNKKRELILQGPPIKMKKQVEKFKKKHNNTFEKNKRIYSKEKNKLSEKKFISEFKKNNKKLMKEMGISNLRII